MLRHLWKYIAVICTKLEAFNFSFKMILHANSEYKQNISIAVVKCSILP